MDEQKGDFIKKARAKLVELYSRYVKNPSDDKLQKTAMEIHQEYANAIGSLLDEKTSKAVHKTATLALGEFSVEEAKKILEDLKKED